MRDVEVSNCLSMGLYVGLDYIGYFLNSLEGEDRSPFYIFEGQECCTREEMLAEELAFFGLPNELYLADAREEYNQSQESATKALAQDDDKVWEVDACWAELRGELAY